MKVLPAPDKGDAHMLRRSAQHCSPDCPGSLDLHRFSVNIPGTLYTQQRSCCQANNMLASSPKLLLSKTEKKQVIIFIFIRETPQIWDTSHTTSRIPNRENLLTFHLCQRQRRSGEECSPARLGRWRWPQSPPEQTGTGSYNWQQHSAEGSWKGKHSSDPRSNLTLDPNPPLNTTNLPKLSFLLKSAPQLRRRLRHSRFLRGLR